MDEENKNLQTAVFAAGCFWCYETLYRRLKGVESVTSGYAGGEKDRPTYQEVSSESTGHAECIKIVFDAEVISYEKLVEIFWTIHDPTTLNRQGNDVGTQYRSAIFYNSPEQKAVAEKSKSEVEESGKFEDPIVTEIVELGEFFEAEDYHQNYYNNNKGAGYCSVVISPKVKKFYERYGELLKEEEKD